MEMEAQKIEGTPAIDALVDLLGNIVIQVKKAGADGKFDWNDTGFFFPLIPQLSSVAPLLVQVIPEAKDMDSAEAVALLAKVAAKAGEVENSEKVKLIVEGVVQIALGGFKIVSGLRA